MAHSDRREKPRRDRVRATNGLDSTERLSKGRGQNPSLGRRAPTLRSLGSEAMNTIKQAFDRLWSGSRSLTAFGISMLLLTAICGSLALIDPTEVDDQVRWIKPAKFGISFALYSFCVAWILGYVN